MSIASDVQTAMTTPLPLFIVAGTLDLTNHITVPSYKVNLQDVYEEWTDNNKTTHRDIVAKKVQGSFSVHFETLEEYLTFIATLKESKKQNGSYDCSVYCQNMLEAYNIEMFIDYDPPNVMPYVGVKDYDAIEIEVMQRGNQYVRS